MANKAVNSDAFPVRFAHNKCAGRLRLALCEIGNHFAKERAEHCQGVAVLVIRKSRNGPHCG
jgi:hypothetical protein